MTKKSKGDRLWMHLSRPTVLLLKLGLFGISLQSATLAIVVHDTLQRDPYYVALYYPPAIEYIALSVLLIALGVLLFEIMARDIR